MRAGPRFYASPRSLPNRECFLDPDRLAFAAGLAVVVYDLRTGLQIPHFISDTPLRLLASGSGRVAAVNDGGELIVMRATDLEVVRKVSLGFRATALACSAEVAALGAVEGCFCVSLESGEIARLDGGEKRIPTSCAVLGRALAFGCSDNSVSVYII